MKELLNSNPWEDFQVDNSIADTKEIYEKYIEFSKIIKQIPKKELVKKGWLKDTEDTSLLVPLFQSIRSNTSKTLFRKNSTANEALYALWLSRVTNIAQNRYFTNQVPKFKGITKENLRECAKLSINENSIIDLPNYLANYGIILIYEESMTGMKLDGAVFKLVSGNPVIGISFRFPRLDSFWFTLLHELSHIVLHYPQLDTPIFDDMETSSDELIEKQANRLAKNSFVERSIWRSCEPKYISSDKSVYKFSEEIGIHPAIVAGMLRHEKDSYTIFNKIINKTNTRKLVFNHE